MHTFKGVFYLFSRNVNSYGKDQQYLELPEAFILRFFQSRHNDLDILREESGEPVELPCPPGSRELVQGVDVQNDRASLLYAFKAGVEFRNQALYITLCERRKK